MTERTSGKIEARLMQQDQPYHFKYALFQEGEGNNGPWGAWHLIDEPSNPKTSETNGPNGDGMSKPLFLNPASNPKHQEFHDKLLSLELARGNSLSITVTADGVEVGSGSTAEPENKHTKPPEYEAVTVAALSNLMEQCIQESFHLFEHFKKEEGMEYEVDNVQSVAQTMFHKATDDRSIIPKFSNSEEASDDIPF